MLLSFLLSLLTAVASFFGSVDSFMAHNVTGSSTGSSAPILEWTESRTPLATTLPADAVPASQTDIVRFSSGSWRATNRPTTTTV